MKKEREKYRAVFNTDLGIEVLDDMAQECGFYDNLDTSGDMVLFNFYRLILQKLGIFDKKHIRDAAVMRKLMELPLVPEEKDG